MTREIPSAQVWFAGGERVGYDPNARAIVQTPGDALRVFLRREGDLAHAVSFLPGFPDGSFGWTKVLPYLPSGADMPKLFLDYVGMGDSDKPKDYAYSTAEPKFPHSEALKNAKRFAYLKLMEKNQNTDPFKFIIYSAKAGEQTPQINPEDVDVKETGGSTR